MATGSCTVTRGATVASTTQLTSTVLNQLGAPSVKVDNQSIGKDQLVKSEVIDLLGTGASGYNYLDNGNFGENRWFRGSTPVSCAAGQRTFRADEWWCRPTGAPVTYERVQSGPDADSLHSAKLTGATSVALVEFGQDIPRRIATALGAPMLLSFQLRNDTGAAVTPTVALNTPTLADNFTAVTTQLTASATTSAANGAWTLFEIPVDLTGIPNLDLGLQVVLRIPSGALNSGAKSVGFSQCQLELSSDAHRSPFFVQREEAEAEQAASSNVVENLLRNGGFDQFLQPGVALSCSAGVDTGNARGWFVEPIGAAVTAERSAAAPANNLTGVSLKVTGNTGVNAVHVGQNLGAAAAQKLRRPVMLSFWMRYTDGATGATITPNITLSTPATSNDWINGSAQATAALNPCPHNTWTHQEYSFDASGYSNLDKGLRISLDLASGNLDASAKYVELAQVQLEEGATASTYHPKVEPQDSAAPLAAAAGLVIASTGAATITVACDEILLRSADGVNLVARAVSSTITISNAGLNARDAANTSTAWHYLYIVSNGSSHGALISLSNTLPSLPAGYVFSAMVGAVRTTGSATHQQFRQIGREVWLVAIAMSAFATATNTITALDLSGVIPPNARTVRGIYGVTSANNMAVQLGADAALTGPGVTAFAGQNSAQTIRSYTAAAAFEVPIVTAQSIWYQMFNTSPTYKMEVTGFKL